MESPFYPSTASTNSGSFTLYLEPILDSYSQTYRQVITLSCMPPGPLAAMVKTMSLPKLSPFVSYLDQRSEFGFGCSFVLMRYPNGSHHSLKNTSSYMYSEDIPAVFSYLTNNGYTIDNSVTKMMNGSRVLVGNGNGNGNGDKRLICFASFVSNI
jgi:hypothetical protein